MVPAEVGVATVDGGVVTTEGDLLQMSEFQLPAGEEVPIGSGEDGACVLPDDVIQETPEGVVIDQIPMTCLEGITRHATMPSLPPSFPPPSLPPTLPPSLPAESLPLATVEDTASQDLWEGKEVESLVTGEGVEGAAVMEEEHLSGPVGEDRTGCEDRTGSDLPVSAKSCCRE